LEYDGREVEDELKVRGEQVDRVAEGFREGINEQLFHMFTVHPT